MRSVYLLVFFVACFFLSGCSVVELVFKAGMLWAFLLVGVLLFLAGWLYFRRKKK